MQTTKMVIWLKVTRASDKTYNTFNTHNTFVPSVLFVEAVA